MQARRVIASWFVALFLGSIGAFAQDTPPDGQDQPQSPQKLCFKCRRTGKLACTQHKPEDDVPWCSWLLTRPCCLGIGFTLCPKCKIEAAMEEWSDLKAKRDAWLDAREKLDKDVGEKLVHLENPHFRLAFGITSVETDDRKLDQHKGAHLYLTRLEALWRLYLEVFSLTDGPAKPIHEIFLFQNLETHDRFLRKFKGRGGAASAGLKTWGSSSEYVTWRQPKMIATEDLFHGNVIHNAAHLVLDKYQGYKNRPPAWLDEGWSLWCEKELTGEARTFCFVEAATESSWKKGDWHERIRKDVVKKTQPSFLEIYDKELNALTDEDIAFSYSYVDFLITKDKALFKKFVDVLKTGKKTVDALREVYGWLPVEFEENWSAWVLQHYAS